MIKTLIFLAATLLMSTPTPYPVSTDSNTILTVDGAIEASVGRLQCLAARDWKSGKWVVVATDSEGRVIMSPETLPDDFIPPDLYDPLWLGTASVDEDDYSTVILTDKLGRVIIKER